MADLYDAATQMARRAREAAYVTVGLGVLGVQRAQAARHDVTRAVGTDQRLARLRDEASSGTHELTEHVATWLDDTIQLLSSQLEPLEHQLPGAAREIAAKARAGMCAVGTQLRQAVSPGD